MNKLLLILVYPFVYLLNPRIRRANALRIKFWAADRDFFQEERKVLIASSACAFLFYAGIVLGIPSLYWIAGHTVKASMENISAVNKSLIRTSQSNINERDHTALELHAKPNKAYEEMMAAKAKKEAEKLKELEPDQEIQSLLQQAKDKKASGTEQP